ncbi:hypothetical protein [Pelagibius sp. Alg239-R121]|uniref:hypothetical protein n=1 Tax=Pelagibius sp. Alg239-R121 TaxID=2993448 RepID=UPI0024A687A1|nr:hypothetical protein [Pelagibius sp. Alg239-R121]
MTNQLSAFEKLDGVVGVYVAHKGNLRCAAIRLTDGRLCLFSPVRGIGPTALESLAEIGEVAFLLAPNHYHHMGLREYAGTFPDARVCAPDGAAPRLRKVTELPVESLEAIENLLGDEASFITPEGLKTGEVWLRIKGAKKTSWLVVDAFCGPQFRIDAMTSSEPEVLKPFPTYGTGNKPLYAAWATAQIRDDKPEILIPCHGTIVRAQDLPAKLEKLIEVTFKT